MGLPRILREDDRIEGGTMTASAADTGYPDDNVQDWREYYYWQASGANSYWIKCDSGSDVTANCFALAGHNLSTVGVTTILLEGSDNDADWTTVVAAFAPPNGDEAIAKFFTQVNYRYWRVTLGNGVGANYTPQIGIFYVGNYVELPRLSRTPFDPDQIQDTNNKNIGGTGYLMEVNHEYSMRRTTYTSNLITQTFVDNTWKPFLFSHREDNFIFVWDYENHSDEVRLMRFADDNHTMPYQGLYRELNFTLEGRMVEDGISA